MSEIKPKIIKKTHKILITAVASFVIIFASLPILLNNSKIQNQLAQIVTKELSHFLDTKVSVGKVEYELFNKISIAELYVEDKANNQLLNIGNTKAHFNFWKMFRSQIIVEGITIDNLNAHIVIDSLGKSNFDFIIKAFKKPKKQNRSEIAYSIQRLKINNSAVLLNNYSAQPDSNKSMLIDFNNLFFKDLNIDLSLNILNNDSLNVQLHHLGFVEQSGFELKRLTTAIEASKNTAKIKMISLDLPKSCLKLANIELKYDSLGSLNNIINNVRWKVPVANFEIYLDDFKAIHPAFKLLKEPLIAQGQLNGRISNLKFQQIEMQYGENMKLLADIDFSGLPNIDDVFVFAQIHELSADKGVVQDIVSSFSKRPFVLPAELNKLGKINYNGNITGFLSNLVVFGNLKTNLGSVTTDILLKFENMLKDLSYNGTIRSNNFQLGSFLNNPQFGKLSFSFNTNGIKKFDTAFRGKMKARINELSFNNYTYNDLKLDGNYDGNGFDGVINIEDENLNAKFAGIIDLTQRLPIFDFDLDLRNFNPYELKLTKEYPNLAMSFMLHANMVGNSLDNINGILDVDSIQLINGSKQVNVDNIQLTSRISDNQTNFNISSDYINGGFTGNFKYSTIGNTINQIVQKYLPSIANNNKTDYRKNTVNVDLQIRNTAEISDLLDLGLRLDGVSTIKGDINELNNTVKLTVQMPSLAFKRQVFENLNIDLHNDSQMLHLTSRGQIEDKNGITSLYVLASAAKDSVNTQMGWQNSSVLTNAGELQTSTKLQREGEKMSAQMRILPTQVIISDTVWDIRASRINLNSDKTFDIKDFRFENNNQHLHIDGRLSKLQSDAVKVNLNEVNLEYILNLVKLKGITIGGYATGNASFYSVLDQPIFLADLKVRNVAINRKHIGNAVVGSTWDKENAHINLAAIFTSEENDTIANAAGVYVPKADSIDVTYNAKKLSIEFLTPYFDGIVQNAKADASGKIRMFGPMKTINFEGDVFLRNAQLSLDMLQTTYYFNDSLHLTPRTIEIRDVKVYDAERNQANVNGVLKHNGLFQKMTYDVNIRGRNILAMNTTAKDNDYFYGKVYANGSVSIFGDDNEANIVVNASSQPRSKAYIMMGGSSTAADNSFIQFIDKNKTAGQTVATVAKSNFNTKVDMQIDITPDAEIELIVDPQGGDAITGKSNGSMRVQFDTFSDMKLFGNVEIESGFYLFTLQTILRRQFKIEQGSSISFTGDPFDAQMNLRAIYPLNASLIDLLEADVNRNAVPVNVILKLNDDLMKPKIAFDIELPTSDDIIKQRVRDFINTEEMMNRQISMLLIANRFFSPNQANPLSAIFGLSFVATTVSTHLNNLIQNALGSNNFSLGFDWQKTNELTDQFNTQLMFQPNERIVINSNVGYRNDVVTTEHGNVNFDFDGEYLLTKSGNLSIKAYQRTIDRSQLRTAKYTRGVGLSYKENFSSVGEMLNYYWRMIKFWNNKKEITENEITENEQN